MNIKIEYIIDNKGKHKSVIIPHRQWKNLQSDYSKLRYKLRIILGIKNAVEEVNSIRTGVKKGKTLRRVLDELPDNSD